MSFSQCDSRVPAQVFSSYAFGDPVPWNALYIGEEGEVDRDEAITIYVRCEREAGHTGKHLARKTKAWSDQ